MQLSPLEVVGIFTYISSFGVIVGIVVGGFIAFFGGSR